MGSAFGTPGHLRLSFATSDKVLTECVVRMKALLANAPTLQVAKARA
jgi:aspartate aminotransferase